LRQELRKLVYEGFKGLAADIPLAATEGFRNVPALYGEQAWNNGTVTDWKSGAIVGEKYVSAFKLCDKKTNTILSHSSPACQKD